MFERIAMLPEKLNLGCGDDYRVGWWNVDNGNCRKDMHHDLECTPYPLPSNYFSETVMAHCIEHISRKQFPFVVKELHRITKSTGVIRISAPYYISRNAFTDFTHKNFMTEESFSYFDPSHKLRSLGKIYGLDFEFKTRFYIDRDRMDPEANIYYELVPIK
jgi:predicted SAM-dependent methyltransferase